MDKQILAIYTLVSDLLQRMKHQENVQCRMSDAEVITTAIVAALYFGGKHESARSMLNAPQYIPEMLSKSRFCRRLHRVRHLVITLIDMMGEHWKALNEDAIYVIDSFPVAVCDNWRIRRSSIYKGEAYRGKIASKKRYFYGVKLHLMVTVRGEPVEFFLSPGSESDVTYLTAFSFNLPDESEVYADKAYNKYWVEDIINETGMVEFWPVRKKNSKRKYPPWKALWIKKQRKMVETTGSLIESRLPKSIHAVTAAGFELKIALFVLAESISHIFKVAI